MRMLPESNTRLALALGGGLTASLLIVFAALVQASAGLHSYF